MVVLCFQRQQWTPVVRLLAQKKHAAVRLAVVAEPASRPLARRRLPHAALRLPRVTATALRRRQRRARVLGTRRLRVRRQRLVALVSESQVTVTRVHWSFISDCARLHLGIVVSWFLTNDVFACLQHNALTTKASVVIFFVLFTYTWM